MVCGVGKKTPLFSSVTEVGVGCGVEMRKSCGVVVG